MAISHDLSLLGVAVASGSTSVGDRVAHAKPGVGVVATQAYTNVVYGVKGLELLRKGSSPTEALSKLLSEDSESDKRQVAIIDFKGRKAVFTGANVPEYRAEIVGKDYVVIGNLLSKENVAVSVAEAFESSSGNLALRLAKALEAGSKSGGDRRGEVSAALTVISAEKVEVKIKIDFHENPIDELFQKLKLQHNFHLKTFNNFET
ncbi:MAG: DUF1028 domain-containing protein [Candidatus Bathyarchaeia archaeon]